MSSGMGDVDDGLTSTPSLRKKKEGREEKEGGNV